VVDSCEHSNESLVSTKGGAGEFLDCVNDC